MITIEQIKNILEEEYPNHTFVFNDMLTYKSILMDNKSELRIPNTVLQKETVDDKRWISSILKAVADELKVVIKEEHPQKVVDAYKNEMLKDLD